MIKEIAETVLERANGYCEACGLPGQDLALHHRRLRSQGGKDEVANLIAVHHKCHNLGTHSIHLNPSKAVANGQIVPSWAEPSEFPLYMPDGSKVLLGQDGSYITIEGEGNGSSGSGWQRW